ncbi:MAG: hypothetical protein OJJ55_19120 [Rhodococcus sp.]|nr:hypothetical protein [Rhodococcus sp. (in: high G+C Gram-positive bacteria)]
MAKAKKLGISELREKKDLARKMRRPFERDWYLNMAFIAGDQYVEYALEPINRLVEIEDVGIRALNNICIKIARTEQAKILKTRPVPTALPATDSEDDMYAARVIDAYFRYLQDEWNFDRRLRNAVYWLVATGNMFMKWYWNDATKSNQMAVISPFDIYPDPYAKTMLDMRWMIHTEFMSEDQAKEIWGGVKGADVTQITTSATDTLTPVETRVFSHFGDGATNLPGVVINEYWEPPSPSCLDGRFIVFTDQAIIYQSKYPYAHGRLPFTHAGHVPRTNSKYSASVMDFVRPLQVELNRAESQIIENRNIANGIWFIPTEVELDSPVTGEPRQIVKWNGPPALNPQNWFVTPPAMAAWVGTEPDRIKNTAQDIVAQHEVSHGGVPGRVESGQAIQLLQETDDSVLTTTIHSVEEAVSDGFMMAALLFKEFADAEIVVRAYDKDGMIEVDKLQKDHIALDLRVRVQTQTGLPQTIAGKWDRVLNLLQYEVIDPKRAIELLDLSSEDPELAPEMQDRKNAYRENKKMLDGAIIRPEVWDNHDVHMEELDKFRKTEEYRRAVNADPPLAKKFQFHWDQHEELRAMVDQKNVQREMMLQGQAPPGPPAGPPPPGGPPPDQGGEGLTSPQPPAPAPNGSPAPVA